MIVVAGRATFFQLSAGGVEPTKTGACNLKDGENDEQRKFRPGCWIHSRPPGLGALI